MADEKINDLPTPPAEDSWTKLKRARQEALDSLRVVVKRFGESGKIDDIGLVTALQNVISIEESAQQMNTALERALERVGRYMGEQEQTVLQVALVQRSMEQVLTEKKLITSEEVDEVAEGIVQQMNGGMAVPTSKA